MAISNEAQEISALAELYAYAEDDRWDQLINSIAGQVVHYARSPFTYSKRYYLRRRNRPGKPRFSFSDGSKGELVMTMTVVKPSVGYDLKFIATIGDVSISDWKIFSYDDLLVVTKNAIRALTRQVMNEALTGGTPCL